MWKKGAGPNSRISTQCGQTLFVLLRQLREHPHLERGSQGSGVAVRVKTKKPLCPGGFRRRHQHRIEYTQFSFVREPRQQLLGALFDLVPRQILEDQLLPRSAFNCLSWGGFACLASRGKTEWHSNRTGGATCHGQSCFSANRSTTGVRLLTKYAATSQLVSAKAIIGGAG